MARAIGRLVAVGGCALALTTQPAQAAFPGVNGQIAYERLGGIWVMNPDGGAQAPLIPDASMPAWSPDGQRLAFVRGTWPRREIWVANADGTGQAQVVSSDADDIDPAWSPDGRTIAFASDADQERRFPDYDIFVVDAGGGRAVQLTDNDEWDVQPAWSPDGRTIAFANRFAIWTMNADGSAATQITHPSPGVGHDEDSNPTWSPDGRRIAFTNRFSFIPTVNHFTIHVANADGTGERMVDAAGDRAGEPAWSPDGRSIALAAGFPPASIVAVNPDDTAPAIGLAGGTNPDWGTRPPTVAPPPPPPRDTTGPAIAISRRAVRATRRGVVAVRLRCPAGEPAGCRGRLSLRARVRRRTVSLGSATFRIDAGRTATVGVRLSRAKRRLLGRRGHLRVAATVRAIDQARNTGSTRATFLLRAPRRR